MKKMQNETSVRSYFLPTRSVAAVEGQYLVFDLEHRGKVVKALRGVAWWEGGRSFEGVSLNRVCRPQVLSFCFASRLP